MKIHQIKLGEIRKCRCSVESVYIHLPSSVIVILCGCAKLSNAYDFQFTVLWMRTSAKVMHVNVMLTKYSVHCFGF